MRFREFLTEGRSSITHTVELATENDGADVEILYFFDTTSGEAEGGYTYSNPTVELDRWTLDHPFKLEGVTYKKFEPVLAKHIDFDNEFKAKHSEAVEKAINETATTIELEKLVDAYVVYVFDTYVADTIDVEVKNYPRSR